MSNAKRTKDQQKQKRAFEAMKPHMENLLAQAFQRELEKLGPRASELSYFNVKNAEEARKQRESTETI